VYRIVYMDSMAFSGGKETGMGMLRGVKKKYPRDREYSTLLMDAALLFCLVLPSLSG
jgi:hypothetical protein